MLLRINFKSGMPVYLQLVDQIRYAAASARCAGGANRCPPMRPLAEELRVNRNTVAKAYTRNWKARVIRDDSGQGLLSSGRSNSPFTQVRPGENC